MVQHRPFLPWQLGIFTKTAPLSCATLHCKKPTPISHLPARPPRCAACPRPARTKTLLTRSASTCILARPRVAPRVARCALWRRCTVYARRPRDVKHGKNCTCATHSFPSIVLITACAARRSAATAHAHAAVHTFSRYGTNLCIV